jgi:hypothetical protein
MASTPVVTVDVYGDDSMMGIQSVSSFFFTTITQNTEPFQAQAILQSQFEDSGIAVVDKASGGTASNLPDLLAGSDGGGPPLADRITSASVVIEEHGLNEIYESVDDYKADLAQWRQTVLNAGAIPVLEEASPSCDSNQINEPQYIQAMADFAAANGVTLISQYAAIQALPDWQAHLGNCKYPDDYLTTFRAQREAAALAPLIQKIIGE